MAFADYPLSSPKDSIKKSSMPPMASSDWHRLWSDRSATAMADYRSGAAGYVAGLPPQIAVALPGTELAQLLYSRLGATTFQRCIDPSVAIPSPLAATESTEWLRTANVAGVNVRTISSFWNVVKYALTLPQHVSGIHLLPIWEPGVVASLYGMASWRINPEFFSSEMASMFRLGKVEDQLRVCINLLHAMGKTVGMDVIPHVDRYAEQVLANPAYFEWLRRRELTIVDHRADLHEEAEAAILAWLQEKGAANEVPVQRLTTDTLFRDLSEEQRLRTLFGAPEDYDGRRDRRITLVDYLYRQGLEPVPATMAPPYRGLEVDPSPEALTTDDAGRVWRDYRITEPQEMSRVFGPLTRYKLYERLDDNRDWAIDFERPRPTVWDYVTGHYAAIQRQFGFDFMRGDMSHVQMRPDGVPNGAGEYYDPLRAVKAKINAAVPYFAYFAESFLTPPDFMAYGDEVKHLEASLAETTLGDLQSTVPGSPAFLERLADYQQIAATSRVQPCFTIITGDKDDPRFDEFYLHGNEARLFTGLLLRDWPSYFSLGFEQRDPHPEPRDNEWYTKLYVFHLDEGPKATAGPYRWGGNVALFERLDRIHRFVAELGPALGEGRPTHWLLPPAPSAPHPVLAWTQADRIEWLFVVNFGTEPVRDVTIALAQQKPLPGHFSTHRASAPAAVPHGKELRIDLIQGGEGLAYRLA
jgi:hypothetical protein